MRIKLLIHGKRSRQSCWVSNAGGNPEEPAFSSVPRCKPRSSGDRHNNPRRVLSVPRPWRRLRAPRGRTRLPDHSFRPLQSLPAAKHAEAPTS
ncbi:TPA: hypothetical protein BOS_9698 [Bos taurus]|nr:TPA: hypothetical protein BOS_9698 [Bos taurus]